MRRALPLLLLAAAATLAVWIASQSPPAATPADPDAGAAGAAGGAAATTTPPPPTAAERQAAPPPADTPPAVHALQRYPADRRTTTLRGIVLADHEQPAQGVAVELRPSFGGIHPLLPIADDRPPAPRTARTDALGGFRFDVVAIGPCRLSATAADGRRAALTLAVTGDDDEPCVLRLGEAPAEPDLTVQVVDGEARPLAGATVELRTLPPGRALLALGADDRPATAAELSGTTGADGTCIFATIPSTALCITAAAGDLRGQLLRDARLGDRRPDRVTLQLSPCGSLAGEFTGAGAEALRDSRLLALAMRYPDQPYYTAFGLRREVRVDGTRFTFAALPAGSYALHLQSPQGLRLALPTLPEVANSVAPLVVVIRSGERTEVTAAVAAGGTIEGSVRRSDGAPIAGASVDSTLVPATSNYPAGFELLGAVVWRLDSPAGEGPNHPAAQARAVTDADGRYALRGLPPGRHRLEVAAAGLAFAQRSGIEVDSTAPVRQDFVLDHAGVLQGRLPGGSYLAVRRVGADRCAMAMILADDGTFTLPGLAEGDYELGKLTPGEARFARLTTAHVTAGRTTWVDLRGCGPVRIAGTLRSARGEPLQATVRLWSARMQSRSDGSFELRLPWQVRRGTVQSLEVQLDGLCWQLPLPPAALGTDDWSGTFTLGGEQLEVLLLDADGAPLAGQLSLRGGNLQRARVPVGADGRALLRWLEPGRYALQASAKDQLIAAREVDLPAAGPVRLAAEPSTTLEVLVLDARGQPCPRLPVEAARWTRPGPPSGDVADYQPPWHAASTGADGRARLVVPAGDLLVLTHVWDTDRRQQQQVRVLAGVPAQLVLRLP